jgi:hypothetical protein
LKFGALSSCLTTITRPWNPQAAAQEQATRISPTRDNYDTKAPNLRGNFTATEAPSHCLGAGRIYLANFEELCHERGLPAQNTICLHLAGRQTNGPERKSRVRVRSAREGWLTRLHPLQPYISRSPGECLSSLRLFVVQPHGFQACAGAKGCGQAMTFTLGCCTREKEKGRKEEEGLQRRTRGRRRTAVSTANDSPLRPHICTGTRSSMGSMDR